MTRFCAREHCSYGGGVSVFLPRRRVCLHDSCFLAGRLVFACWRVMVFVYLVLSAFLLGVRWVRIRPIGRLPRARASLKYPGRDRTKSAPTPKRKNRRLVSRGVLPVCPARAQASRLEARVLADQGACGVLGTNMAVFKQGSVTCECMLRNAI